MPKLSAKPRGVILRLPDEGNRSEIPALPERTSASTNTKTKCAITAGKFSHKLFVPASALTHHIKRFNRRRAYSMLVFKRIDFLAQKRPQNCMCDLVSDSSGQVGFVGRVRFEGLSGVGKFSSQC